MIDEAKRKAASANRTASDTMDKVNAIRQEVDKIGGVAPGDGNLNKVLKDVDTSSEIQGLFLTSVMLVLCFIPAGFSCLQSRTCSKVSPPWRTRSQRWRT